MSLVVLLQPRDIAFTRREIIQKNSGINSLLFVNPQAMSFIWRALKKKAQVFWKKMAGTCLPAQMNGLRLLMRKSDLTGLFGSWIGITLLFNTTLRLLLNGVVSAVTGKGNAYENPLRDKTHGRIWRVVSQDAKENRSLSLNKNDPDDLIEALKNDNLFWRMTAQRLLVERGNLDVLPELYDLVKNNDIDELGYNYAATHALWIIDGLGALAKMIRPKK